MRIVLDERPLEVKTDSVADAIAAASEAAHARGRLIAEVLADGRRWSDDELRHALADGSAQTTANRKYACSELRLTSLPRLELVEQTLISAAESLVEAGRLQRSAAHSVQADRLSDAMNDLTQAFSIWEEVRQALIMSCQAAGISLDDPMLMQSGDCTIQGAIQKLNDQLRAVADALAAGNTVGLCDALLYDFPPIVLEWRSLLEQIRSAVCQPAGSAAASTES